MGATLLMSRNQTEALAIPRRWMIKADKIFPFFMCTTDMPRTQMEDRFGLLDAVLTPTPISIDPTVALMKSRRFMITQE
jgi:hypothetical protein